VIVIDLFSHLRNKGRQKELIKEKRQSLIDKAVTKGLDMNVPLKDSGSQFYSQIP
jgi:type I restriction enzyme, S subunit